MSDSRSSHSADPSLSRRERLARKLCRPDEPLGARFLALTEAARGAWRLSVDATRFALHVAALLEATEHDVSQALSELCIGDLYLACSCVDGTPAALSAFDAQYLRNLQTFVKDIDSSPARLDELKQLLRERILVKHGDAPARIGSYSGRGALRAWVQVAAQRLALSSVRGKQPKTVAADEEALQGHVGGGSDPELDYLRVRYAEEFRAALQAALGQLASRDRLILRLHFVDGLSLTRIAGMYRVSQSSVSRWMLDARESVREYMKAHLKKVHGLSSSEFESIVFLVQSRLDLSLTGALQTQMA
jgi:RNA polymerase sigma-70 factor (ECF subfamily)